MPSKNTWNDTPICMPREPSMPKYKTHDLVGVLDLEGRKDQGGFHLVSESAMRLEYMRFRKGDQVGPFKYAGELLVTCAKGSFVVGEDLEPFGEIEQMFLCKGEVFLVKCTSDQGAIQIIWAPAHEVVERLDG